MAALVSVLTLSLAALGCGQSEDDNRRPVFEDQLRASLEAQQVPDGLTDCLVEAIDRSVTDEELALVPANAAGLPSAAALQLSAIAARRAQEVLAACPDEARALQGTYSAP